MPGHLGSARSGEDVAASLGANPRGTSSEAVMGLKSLLSKWVRRKPTSPPPPNGPARPSV